MIHLLFVCSRNRWRSPTAEAVWRREPGIAVRSAGTSASARHVITEADIRWADVIFVMEHTHRSRMRKTWREVLNDTPIHVLGIPDQYGYMDDELVQMLRDSVAAFLDMPEAGQRAEGG
jgi:predicted protein tyrosine phosphatase